MTSTIITTPRPRRMAREPQLAPFADPATTASATDPAKTATKTPSKLDRVEALLLVPAGASIAELMDATGWQQHSVRGAMAGALRKRGLIITSDKGDGLRRYRAERPA
jgi:hypothetical protein